MRLMSIVLLVILLAGSAGADSHTCLDPDQLRIEARWRIDQIEEERDRLLRGADSFRFPIWEVDEDGLPTVREGEGDLATARNLISLAVTLFRDGTSESDRLEDLVVATGQPELWGMVRDQIRDSVAAGQAELAIERAFAFFSLQLQMESINIRQGFVSGADRQIDWLRQIAGMHGQSATASFQPALGCVFEGPNGDYHWLDGWYATEDRILVIEDVTFRNSLPRTINRSEPGWTVRGRHFLLDSPERYTQFEYWFFHPCSFIGWSWLHSQPDPVRPEGVILQDHGNMNQWGQCAEG